MTRDEFIKNLDVLETLSGSSAIAYSEGREATSAMYDDKINLLKRELLKEFTRLDDLIQEYSRLLRTIQP